MSGRAPGSPGIEPRWTSSAKQAVGTSRSAASPVWFTLSHGTLDEVYFPRIDSACLRDAEFLAAWPDGTVFEEKRDGIHTLTPVETAVPAFRVETADPGGRLTLVKRFATDPRRPTMLIDVEATVPEGQRLPDLTFLVAPHLENHGGGNTARVGDYKGVPVVYASRGRTTLAVATTAPPAARSVGYVGVSDPWQELHANGTIGDWDEAPEGNVAMGIRPDLDACAGRFTVAIGFGSTEAEAGQRAIASLRDGFEAGLTAYAAEWQEWNAGLARNGGDGDRLERTSAAVVAVHEAKSFPGGLIASLSIPWGFARGDGDLGGYHLVWPRDHAEAAGALFAVGAFEDGLRALSYLRATQERDGHWAQNMWLDGTPYWNAVQMDETALPILLVALARTTGALDADGAAAYWPMVRAAARFLVCNGPVTAQDRWEEDGGYSPFTLATEIAALVTAAAMAEEAGEPGVAGYLRETADCWDAHIETWCYVAGTDLAASVGVDGYYVRIGPPDDADAVTPLDGWVPIKNRPQGDTRMPARSVVSPDALALVRFGLRRADDPRIISTVAVVDATLRTDLGYGPGWRRYNDDGYGEHPDGRPFDGSGQGRVWPLLGGERGHYEVAAGRSEAAGALAATMRAMAGDGDLLPEQTWDAGDIEARELRFGRPAGSAMPLVWAHAEYLKLLRSIADGAVFDLPEAMRRHRPDPAAARRRFWRRNHKIQRIDPGADLRIELPSPAVVRWTADDWDTATDSATTPTGIGMHVLDLDTAALPAGRRVRFTMRWEQGWEGTDYEVTVAGRTTR